MFNSTRGLKLIERGAILFPPTGQRAATMQQRAQRERMASLRSTVREFNVYRWAGRMLADAGRWRLRARIEARVRRFHKVEVE